MSRFLFVSVLFSENNTQSSKSLLEMIKSLQLDGIIMREVPRIDKIIDLGIPIIVSPYTKEQMRGIAVIVGNMEADGCMAAEHLLECGLKNFAYCGYRGFVGFRLRGEGFAKRVAKAGFETNIYKQPDSQAQRDWAKEQLIMADWLKSLPKPVGIMTCTDERGENVIEACRIANVYIPEEVAVVGVDNDALICDLTMPPLSSVALNDEKTGFKAAELLEKLMNGQKPKTQSITLAPTHVVRRQSTDTLAVEDHDVVEAVKFIRNNALEPIQIKDVVNSVATTRRSLQRRFHATLGCSIFDEIMRVRIESACRMLVETTHPISEISLKIGHSDIYHIHRWFKKIKGMTPLAYRKKYGQHDRFH